MQTNFSDNSWDDIITACQTNTVPDSWIVGNQKSMNVGGEDFLIDIIGKNHDTYVNGRTAPLTFQFHNVLNGLFRNAFFWPGGDIANFYLPMLKGYFPANVQKAINPVIKKTYNGNFNGVGSVATELFCLSVREVGEGSGSYLTKDEGTPYSFYTDDASRKKTTSDGAAVSWMLRTDGNTTDSENYSMYACLNDGSVDYYGLSGYLYLAPAFCF